MSNWHFSTISCLAANGVGQIFSALFRNGDSGFGGYIVRLMRIGGMGKTGLSANRALVSLAVRKQTDDRTQKSGWYTGALTIPRLN
jgi:hypothetical protein